MNARARIAPRDQLTIKEFLAFTASRPDGERWELIEGVAVLTPSPAEWHQVIVVNISSYLMSEQERLGASWLPLLGVGTNVPLSEEPAAA